MGNEGVEEGEVAVPATAHPPVEDGEIGPAEDGELPFDPKEIERPSPRTPYAVPPPQPVSSGRKKANSRGEQKSKARKAVPPTNESFDELLARHKAVQERLLEIDVLEAVSRSIPPRDHLPPRAVDARPEYRPDPPLPPRPPRRQPPPPPHEYDAPPPPPFGRPHQGPEGAYMDRMPAPPPPYEFDSRGPPNRRDFGPHPPPHMHPHSAPAMHYAIHESVRDHHQQFQPQPMHGGWDDPYEYEIRRPMHMGDGWPPPGEQYEHPNGIAQRMEYESGSRLLSPQRLPQYGRSPASFGSNMPPNSFSGGDSIEVVDMEIDDAPESNLALTAASSASAGDIPTETNSQSTGGTAADKDDDGGDLDLNELRKRALMSLKGKPKPKPKAKVTVAVAAVDAPSEVTVVAAVPESQHEVAPAAPPKPPIPATAGSVAKKAAPVPLKKAAVLATAKRLVAAAKATSASVPATGAVRSAPAAVAIPAVNTVYRPTPPLPGAARFGGSMYGHIPPEDRLIIQIGDSSSDESDESSEEEGRKESQNGTTRGMSDTDILARMRQIVRERMDATDTARSTTASGTATPTGVPAVVAATSTQLQAATAATSRLAKHEQEYQALKAAIACRQAEIQAKIAAKKSVGTAVSLAEKEWPATPDVAGNVPALLHDKREPTPSVDVVMDDAGSRAEISPPVAGNSSLRVDSISNNSEHSKEPAATVPIARSKRPRDDNGDADEQGKGIIADGASGSSGGSVPSAVVVAAASPAKKPRFASAPAGVRLPTKPPLKIPPSLVAKGGLGMGAGARAGAGVSVGVAPPATAKGPAAKAVPGATPAVPQKPAPKALSAASALASRVAVHPIAPSVLEPAPAKKPVRVDRNLELLRGQVQAAAAQLDVERQAGETTKKRLLMMQRSRDEASLAVAKSESRVQELKGLLAAEEERLAKAMLHKTKYADESVNIERDIDARQPVVQRLEQNLILAKEALERYEEKLRHSLASQSDRLEKKVAAMKDSLARGDIPRADMPSSAPATNTSADATASTVSSLSAMPAIQQALLTQLRRRHAARATLASAMNVSPATAGETFVSFGGVLCVPDALSTPDAALESEDTIAIIASHASNGPSGRVAGSLASVAAARAAGKGRMAVLVGGESSSASSRKPIAFRALGKYESPLLSLRAYRLNPYYRTKAGLSLSAPFASNKVDTQRPICRFEMHGVCNDHSCPYQHARDYMLPEEELYLDFASYVTCPSARNAVAVQPGQGTPQAVRDIVTKTRQRYGGRLTRDEMCLIISNEVTLASGMSSGAVFSEPRKWRPLQPPRPEIPTELDFGIRWSDDEDETPVPHPPNRHHNHKGGSANSKANDSHGGDKRVEDGVTVQQQNEGAVGVANAEKNAPAEFLKDGDTNDVDAAKDAPAAKFARSRLDAHVEQRYYRRESAHWGPSDYDSAMDAHPHDVNLVLEYAERTYTALASCLVDATTSVADPFAEHPSPEEVKRMGGSLGVLQRGLAVNSGSAVLWYHAVSLCARMAPQSVQLQLLCEDALLQCRDVDETLVWACLLTSGNSAWKSRALDLWMERLRAAIDDLSPGSADRSRQSRLLVEALLASAQVDVIAGRMERAVSRLLVWVGAGDISNGEFDTNPSSGAQISAHAGPLLASLEECALPAVDVAVAMAAHLDAGDLSLLWLCLVHFLARRRLPDLFDIDSRSFGRLCFPSNAPVPLRWDVSAVNTILPPRHHMARLFEIGVDALEAGAKKVQSTDPSLTWPHNDAHAPLVVAQMTYEFGTAGGIDGARTVARSALARWGSPLPDVWLALAMLEEKVGTTEPVRAIYAEAALACNAETSLWYFAAKVEASVGNISGAICLLCRAAARHFAAGAAAEFLGRHAGADKTLTDAFCGSLSVADSGAIARVNAGGWAATVDACVLLFNKLLGRPVPYNAGLPERVSARSRAAPMWMCLCMLLELTLPAGDAAVADAFEGALADVRGGGERWSVWHEYLVYELSQLGARARGEFSGGASASSPSLSAGRTVSEQLADFTRIVNRCISSLVDVTAGEAGSSRVVLNARCAEVVSMYARALPQQQALAVYEAALQRMPSSVPLALAGARVALDSKLHERARSMLASALRAQPGSALLWRAAAALESATAPIAHARWTYHSAAMALPHDAELWADYAAFEAANGAPDGSGTAKVLELARAAAVVVPA